MQVPIIKKKASSSFFKQKKDSKKHHPYAQKIETGIALVKNKDYDTALDYFKAMLNFKSIYLASILIPLYQLSMLQENDCKLKFLIANLYFEKRHYTQAYDECEEIFEYNPHFKNLYSFIEKIYSKKKIIGIKELLESAFEKKIYDHAILDCLPKIYHEEKNHKKNIIIYKKLIQIDPDNTSHYKTLGELYKHTAQYKALTELYTTLSEKHPNLCEEIAKKCEQCLVLCPENKTLKELIVTLHFKAFNVHKASAHLRELCAQDSHFTQKGISILKEALKTFPKNTDILLALSTLLLKKELLSEAIEALQVAYKTDTSIHEKVLRILTECLEKNPHHCLALQLKATIHFDSGEDENCLQTLEQLCHTNLQLPSSIRDMIQAIKNNTALQHTNYLFALYFYKTGFEMEAIPYCEALFQSDLELKARLLLNEIFQKQSDHRRLSENTFKTLSVFPFELKLHETLKNTLHTLGQEGLKKNENDAFKTGLLYLRIGDPYRALEKFQSIDVQHPHHLQTQILIGRCFLECGRFDMGINHCSRTLSFMDKGNSNLVNQVRFLTAKNHLIFGTVKDGLQLLESIQERDLKFPFVQSLLSIYKDINFSESRIRTVSGYLLDQKTVVAMNYDHQNQSRPIQKISFATQHNNDGAIQLIKKNTRSAEAAFHLALQMDPNLTEAKLNLSLLFIQKKEFQKAASILKKLKENSEYRLLAAAHLSLLYLSEKKEDLALLELKKILSEHPSHELANLHLGDIYYKKGNLKLAFSYWKQILKTGALAHLLQNRLHYLIQTSLTPSFWIAPFSLEKLNLPPNLFSQ